ncbi:MAG: phosphotransferase, partial [Ancrocorticia sp.]
MPLHRLDSPIVAAHKLTSEQSNTSVIYTFADDTKLILKIFRVLAAGHNPDVELQEALDGTGTVPGQYGSVNLTWNHAELQQGEDRGRGRADVVVVQEFLEGSTDAWQVMAEQLTQTNGTLGQTEESIRALGALTRRFHTELANSFPVAPATDAGRATIAASWRAREEAALDLVPELRVHQGAIEAAYANALAQPWPDLQRIHGDYHLGQVLEVPGSGWRALDFEGEPLRPLAERTRLDLALRDVAGMLRSFDYAAGSAELSGGDPQVLHAWAAAASDAFLAGYGDLDSAQDGLLHALMIDKALYEISYEAAERPSWLSVPVNGVERILRHVS